MQTSDNHVDKPLYERLGGHDGILKLIKSFYADVRQDVLLGPIFNSKVQDWNLHLAKITEFWALQSGGTSRYTGGFGMAHQSLGLQPEHFQNWLSLWQFNNLRYLAAREAAEMNTLAQQLGNRLGGIAQNKNSFLLPSV